MVARGAPGERFDVLVIFDVANGLARARNAIGNFPVTREFSLINGFQASMTGAQIRALSSVPGVIRIEENAEVSAHDVYLNDDTGVTEAWTFSDTSDNSIDGTGVTVCVIDTGVNAGHEQFNVDGKSKIVDFADFVNGKPQPYDDQGHGTHVAGIAAGDGAGSHWVAPDAIGAAPGASLAAAKVLDANGQGTNANVISGVEWCSQFDIVSMSLGGASTDGNDALSLAVNCAANPDYDRSCKPLAGEPPVVVVSAGNSGAYPGTIGTPGVADNAITVGSFAEWSGDAARTYQDDGVYLSPFSSRGPRSDGLIKPDIIGVGSRVASAYISNSDSYVVQSGTSMSAPHISGVVALMLQANPGLGVADRHANGKKINKAPHEKVRELLAATAIDRGAPGKDNEYGHGLVDAYAAVALALDSTTFYAPTEYPAYELIEASVANGGEWVREFEVTADHLGLPIAAAMTIDGQLACLWSCSIIYWWDPDLELVVEVKDSGGNWSQVPADTAGSPEVTLSQCPAGGGECGSVGRSELVHFIPDVTGTYRFRVWPYADSPNDGKGGNFSFEISMGGTDSGGGGGAPPPDEPPTVSITAPVDGDPVSGTVSVTANAGDDNGVSQVEFFVGDVSIDTATEDPWSVEWVTTDYDDGPYEIWAVATDTSSQTTTSASVSVTVDNVAEPPAPMSLEVSTSKVKGTRWAHLSWSGLDTVEVRRDGAPVTITAQNPYDDDVGKGGQSVVYQVCEPPAAETSNCSNEVIASW